MTLQTNPVAADFGAGRPVWPAIPLTTAETSIGRAPNNSVTMQHASISRNHCKFIKIENRVELEDLDSRFGTFVNGTIQLFIGTQIWPFFSIRF